MAHDDEGKGEREGAWTAYKNSGVDTRQADAHASQFLEIIKGTWEESAVEVAPTRAFSGIFRCPGDGDGVFWAGSTDGVGTKSRWLREQGLWEVIGWDCVAMNVNDVVVTGAKPLVFMNYMGAAGFEGMELARIVRGMASATKAVRCAMIGGETATMRGVYQEGEVEVVGFCMGQGTRRWELESVQVGDWLVGFESWGMHANGYSMVVGQDFGEEMVRALSQPTRIYGEELARLDAQDGVEVLASVHVTGGGLLGRLELFERGGCRVALDRDALPSPWWMGQMCERWGLEWEAGARIWNAGIGLVVVIRGDVSKVSEGVVIGRMVGS